MNKRRISSAEAFLRRSQNSGNQPKEEARKPLSPPVSYVAFRSPSEAPWYPPADDTNTIIMMTTLSTNSNLIRNHWALDSGANQHSTHEKSAFLPTTLKPYQGQPIQGYGGHSQLPSLIGTARIACKSTTGSIAYLDIPNTVYDPNAGCNIISYSQLIKSTNCNITTTATGFEIQTSKANIPCNEQIGLYFLELWQGPPSSAILAAYSISEPWLKPWHERLGHLGEANLRKLPQMVNGMQPLPDSQICLDCVHGKLRENPHNRPIRRGEYPLELIHVDTVGPISVTGLNGERYFTTLSCDKTILTEAIPHKHRSDSPDIITNFLDRHERPERRCRRIRLDQAGENTSGNMQLIAHSRGITLETTGTDQHQQNGVAEVTNRLIQERTFTSLRSSNVPLKYWPFFVKAQAYIRMYTPHNRLTTTPYEAWYGDKPDISHLRPLGCRAIAYRTKSHQKMVEDKGVECQLLGYQGSRLYLLLRHDKQIVLSSNVVFLDKRGCNVPALLNLPSTSCSTCSTLGSSPKHTLNSTTPRAPKRTRLLDTLVTEDPPAELRLQTLTPPDNSKSHSKSGPDKTVNGKSTPIEKSEEPSQRRLRAKSPEVRIPLRSTKGLHQNRYGFPLVVLCLGVALFAAQETDPTSINQARHSSLWKWWLLAMADEIKSLNENHTWELVNRPEGTHVLRGRWVYKAKRGPCGEITRYKARWVVRGFEQIEGVDFHETFATVVKPMSYKALFAICAALNLELHQMDVKTAFLYGLIDEVIYVEQPNEFNKDYPNKVCKLNRALYGLKQAPRIWYLTLSEFLKSLGFLPLNSDLAIFAKGNVFIAIYVDDLLIAGPNLQEIGDLKAALSKRFHMSDLGECSYYLGMTVKRDRPNRRLALSQEAYIDRMLSEFGMKDCKPATTPMDSNLKIEPSNPSFKASTDACQKYAKAIGTLMYLMLGTRPDISYAVAYLSRWMSNPTSACETALQRLLRYLQGTRTLELTFQGELGPLIGYTDADWGGDPQTRRSTGGYTFSMGSAVISWSSKRQPTVALSSCEAEYMGETQATKEAVWLRSLLKEMNHEQLRATVIFGDNQGAIALAKNPQYHARTKHIAIQHHYVREVVEAGEIEIEYIPTSKMLADGLTKPLPGPAFQKFRALLGLTHKKE